VFLGQYLVKQNSHNQGSYQACDYNLDINPALGKRPGQKHPQDESQNKIN
jgi:hypothetical protein